MSEKPDVKDHSRFKPNGSMIVNAQYVKDLSFENPKAPYSFMQAEQPSIEIDLDVTVIVVQDRSYEVTIGIQCKAMLKDQITFLTDLKYSGLFTLEGDMKEDEKELALYVHAPGVLFPYARRVISDVVRDGGYPPLMISPVDFLGIYLKKKQENSSQQKDFTVN